MILVEDIDFAIDNSHIVTEMIEGKTFQERTVASDDIQSEPVGFG